MQVSAVNVELSRSGLEGGELRQLVRELEPWLRKLAGTSILVTGATGWFGVWLLDLLCAADDVLRLGLRISAVSREPLRFLARHPGFAADPRIAWIEADVRRLDPGCSDCTHIVHAATDSSSEPGSTVVRATNSTRSSRGPGAPRHRRHAVHGVAVGQFRRRLWPGPPRRARIHAKLTSAGPTHRRSPSAYAEGKRAAEQLGAIAAGTGVPVRTARCFAFVGPHMPFDRHFAIGNFIADAVRGRPIPVKSDGRPRGSYLYMTDLVRALMLDSGRRRRRQGL